MRNLAGVISLTLLLTALGLNARAWLGLSSVWSIGAVFWLMHLAVFAVSFASDRVLLQEHRPSSGHLNLKVLRAYLPQGLYRSIWVAFGVALLVFLACLALLQRDGAQADQVALALFSTFWAFAFFVAAAVLLFGRQPNHSFKRTPDGAA